ncbi:MAG: VTT domain-containing protein [Chromatiales bacterium]|nr:VTT domain-containing protein [Chromatiales bacterium]
MRRRVPDPRWSLLLLVLLILLGIVLDALGLFDPRAALERLRDWPAGWALALTLISIQVLMFALALPGSAMVWVVAVLYPPWASTAILTVGGTAGALAAWLFAARMTGDSMNDNRVYRLLERQGDFLTLCAVRLLPGFPHSLINYAAGTLSLPLPRFLVSSAVGLGAKAWLYSSAIHELAGAASAADMISWRTIAPLVVLALLALGGSIARKRWLE